MTDRDGHRHSRLSIFGLVAAFVLVATGCSSGSGGDKAGGAGEPVVLKMASTS